MTTTFDVLVAMAQRLPGTVRGVATGGGYAAGPPAYTYLDDTNVLTAYSNDAWNGATLLIETGTLAGAVLVVSDSIQTSGRVVLSGLLWELNATDTPGAGARYTLINSAWTVGVLLAAADEALRQWGKVESEVALGSGDGQTVAFDLPTGTTGQIARVYLVNEDADLRMDVQWWEETDTGMAFALAPAVGWTVWATVVAWATLTDAPGYEDAEETLGELTDVGALNVALVSGYAVCQTFLLADTYRLSTVKIYNVATPTAATTIPIEIWGTVDGGDDDGKPDYTNVLYQMTATVAAGASYGWVDVSLTEDVVLDAGLYALVALGSTPNTMGWMGGADATYSDGAAYLLDLSDYSWDSLGFDDFMFEVSGQLEVLRGANAVWPDVVPVEFAAWYGAYSLLRGRVGIPGHDQDGMVQLMNYALERAEGERGRAGHVGVRNRERFFRG